jgi:hypothetical protein
VYVEDASYALAWTAASGAVRYEVWRAIDSNVAGATTATPDAALRTLARGHANVLGTQALLQADPRFDRSLRRQRLLAAEYRYMTALYTGRWGGALGLACRLALGFWSPRRTGKEMARIGAIVVLGADRFFGIKRSR